MDLLTLMLLYCDEFGKCSQAFSSLRHRSAEHWSLHSTVCFARLTLFDLIELVSKVGN